MSFDLLKAVPIIHVTLSNMKKAVLHDGWSLSSPNYHHTDQYLTVNIDVLACMVSTSYLVQICRYAEMQICRYAPISQDQRWHTQSGVTDPSKQKHKKTQKHKNSNRVGCPIKTFLLSNGTSNFLSPCFPHFLLSKCIPFPTSSLPKEKGQTSQMTLHRPLIRD